MAEKHYKVCHSGTQRTRLYGLSDCLARVPASLETLLFIGDAAEVIERTHDADGLIVSASPIAK